MLFHVGLHAGAVIKLAAVIVGIQSVIVSPQCMSVPAGALYSIWVAFRDEW